MGSSVIVEAAEKGLKECRRAAAFWRATIVGLEEGGPTAVIEVNRRNEEQDRGARRSFTKKAAISGAGQQQGR